MALALYQVYARSPWRARANFSGGNPAGQLASSFTITRQDGGPTTVVVARLFSVDVSALELVLSEPLINGISYVLTWSAQGFTFRYQLPAQDDPRVQPAGDDPEAEAYGVDLAWISDDPGPSGDCQRRRGIACLQYDLPNRAVLVPGELVQAPTAGAALDQRTNGPASDAELIQSATLLEREFRRDSRVVDAEVQTSQGDVGDINFNGQVLTKATGLPVTVRNT